jgi:hypothetical protein
LLGSRAFVLLNQLNIVTREQAALALGIGSHPPIIVDHLDVGHIFALPKLELVVFGFLVVVLDYSPMAAACPSGRT